MTEVRPLGTLLIVDDEEYVRDSLATFFERKGYAVRRAGGTREALEPSNLEGLDLVLTDLRMPGEDGLTLLRRVVGERPGLPVIVLTGHGSVLSAVEAMKAGAYEFVQKPAEPEALLLLVERALGDSTRRRELKYLRSDGGAPASREDPLGRSPAWLAVMQLATLAAPSDSSVLICGESGTGKEEIAKLIHRRSRRAERPFVRVNCAAIPDGLFESEFFGYRRGAFSGAIQDREGRFRVAHGGTLLLDEIGAMPEQVQAKVLRVLQDGSFDRIGESHSTTVDVRIIAATNADLATAMRAGRFREDLYYRLNVLEIRLPPLRERATDLDEMIPAFLAEFATHSGKEPPRLTDEAMELLRSYPWPGNVRELRNVLERAVLLQREGRITTAELPALLGNGLQGGTLNLRGALAAEERRLLEEALRRAGGLRREAARLLGVDERNLAYFLKKNGLAVRRRDR